MKRLSTLLAVLFAALICVTSCGSSSSSSDDDNNNGGTTSTVILSAQAFVGTEWNGSDANGKVTLKVSSASEMTLNYYIKETVAKNTETELKLVTVTIDYTFDEAKASFSGTGKEDSKAYSGKLSTAKAMTFKTLPTGDVNLTR
ncbi:MAG: hypothetical protein K6F33_09090 [Bacteroidales bacterium]|nr:hypothetical protein [Bacteroidales bacterium]